MMARVLKDRYLSMTASVSISASQSASIKRTPGVMVLAGQMLPKNSPWTAASCSESSIWDQQNSSAGYLSQLSDQSFNRGLDDFQTFFAPRLPHRPRRRSCGPVDNGVVPVTAIMFPAGTAREMPTLVGIARSSLTLSTA